MDIVLASRNRKKIAELQSLLSSLETEPIKILSLDDIGILEDIEENGNSFEENSFIKASAAAKAGYIGIADDSGLCVSALGDRPGIYSARYSGEGATDKSNNEKLLFELKDVPDSMRTAKFVCVVTCAFPKNFSEIKSFSDTKLEPFVERGITDGMQTFSVRGEIKGKILREERGNSGFGYDPLFFVEQKNKTFAELADTEKNEISHRGKAMRIFCELFADIMKGLSC